jgi:hypothetical protein
MAKTKGKGKKGQSFRTSKTVGTGQYTVNPDHRMADSSYFDKEGNAWTRKHVGYGESSFLKEKWLQTDPVKVNANYYKPEKDPGATPQHQRGAYGFAHVEGGRITSGRRYETLADPEKPIYEYEQAQAVRPNAARTGAPYRRGSGSTPLSAAGAGRQQAGGPPGWASSADDDDDIVDAEIVNEPSTGPNSPRSHYDIIDADAEEVYEPGLGRGTPAGTSMYTGLPFRRNAGAVGPASTMGALASGPLGLPMASASPERTEEGTLPMSAGSMAGIAEDRVPGFNTGRPTSGPRRPSMRPRSGRPVMGSNWQGVGENLGAANKVNPGWNRIMGRIPPTP